jgi:hypothetical protein
LHDAKEPLSRRSTHKNKEYFQEKKPSTRLDDFLSLLKADPPKRDRPNDQKFQLQANQHVKI